MQRKAMRAKKSNARKTLKNEAVDAAANKLRKGCENLKNRKEVVQFSLNLTVRIAAALSWHLTFR